MSTHFFIYLFNPDCGSLFAFDNVQPGSRKSLIEVSCIFCCNLIQVPYWRKLNGFVTIWTLTKLYCLSFSFYSVNINRSIILSVLVHLGRCHDLYFFHIPSHCSTSHFLIADIEFHILLLFQTTHIMWSREENH